MSEQPPVPVPVPDAATHDAEVTNRVLYSLLIPTVRLAYLFRVPVKELADLLQMAYFHHARERGLKMREISERLNVSARKAAQLSSRLKTNFLSVEQVHELPRRIEFMLWAGPLSPARIKQVLPNVAPGEVAQAIATLIESGRIEPAEKTGELCVVRSQYRLVTEDWLARIDGLNNLMASAANAVYGRFFRREPRAFARTVSLRVREEDMGDLAALYSEKIWPSLVALDEAAQHDTEARTMDISVLWAPYQFTDTIDPEENP